MPRGSCSRSRRPSRPASAARSPRRSRSYSKGDRLRAEASGQRHSGTLMEQLDDVSTEAPLVTFYRMVAEGNHPMRADRSALGVLPTAAFQYCEAISIASAFGWYVFPPIDFH